MQLADARVHGGPLAHNKDLLTLRWTGYANFEMTYRGQVLLLDAYFDRGSRYRPLGFAAADVTRASAILPRARSASSSRSTAASGWRGATPEAT